MLTRRFYMRRIMKKKTYHLKEYFSLNPDLAPPVTVPFGDGPVSKAVASRKPLVIDYFNPEASKLEVFKKIADLKSFLLVPVIHNELEGVLMTGLDWQKVYENFWLTEHFALAVICFYDTERPSSWQT